MPIKSKRATTMKIDKRKPIDVPWYRQLHKHEHIQQKDFWCVSGQNPNKPKTACVTVAEHEYGKTVEECLLIGGGAYWRFDKAVKETPPEIPGHKASP